LVPVVASWCCSSHLHGHGQPAGDNPVESNAAKQLTKDEAMVRRLQDYRSRKPVFSGFNTIRTSPIQSRRQHVRPQHDHPPGPDQQRTVRALFRELIKDGVADGISFVPVGGPILYGDAGSVF